MRGGGHETGAWALALAAARGREELSAAIGTCFPDAFGLAAEVVFSEAGADGGAGVYVVPLRTAEGVAGALRFRTAPPLNDPHFDTLVRLAAWAVLRVRREEQTGVLQKALLNSLAHNLRTPLASVLGSLGMVRDEGEGLDEGTRRELTENAFAEAQRLNRLLGNLLDLSRLEAGALQARKDLCDVQDAIGAALEQLGSAAASRAIEVKLAPELPFVRMDFVLIVQVLVNLLDNSLRYSSAETPIAVEAWAERGQMKIRVLDEGEGIPERELSQVFEKFRRAGRTGDSGGIGLGLSICKGLVEAHHGTIRAERRQPRGTAVTFSLPLDI